MINIKFCETRCWEKYSCYGYKWNQHLSVYCDCGCSKPRLSTALQNRLCAKLSVFIDTVSLHSDISVICISSHHTGTPIFSLTLLTISQTILYNDNVSHLTVTSVCSLTLLPILLATLYFHWNCFLSYWHFCMLINTASHLTGTSVCSLALFLILLTFLYAN